MRLVGCVQHLSGRPCYCMGRLQGWGGASDEIYDGNARAFFAAVRDVRAIFFRRGSEGVKPMAKPTLTISSRNYSSWSMRGWLLCRMAGLEFVEELMPSSDPSTRAELLHLSPSFLVPRLTHEGISVWSALAVAEYLHERFPEACLLPKNRAARAHCRSVSGEMHSGFKNLRSALSMNVKAHHPGFEVWAGAQADIERIVTIWRECLSAYGGPYLFGDRPTVADAMYAPVCSRFVTYDVRLDPVCAAYRDRVMTLPLVLEWLDAARSEPDEVEELEIEF